MVKRLPEPAAVPTVVNSLTGETETLAASLDKGFPYDDGDNTISDAAISYIRPQEPSVGVLLGKLNGQNVTSEELKALVSDTTQPITMDNNDLEELSSQLVELAADVSDKPASDKVLAPALKKKPDQ